MLMHKPIAWSIYDIIASLERILKRSHATARLAHQLMTPKTKSHQLFKQMKIKHFWLIQVLIQITW